MIRALKDQNRPEAVFTVHPGEALMVWSHFCPMFHGFEMFWSFHPRTCVEKLAKFCTNTPSLVEFVSPFPLFGDVLCIAPGIILEGEDILMATMSLAAAKVRCTGLPNCIGFYSEDWPFQGRWTRWTRWRCSSWGWNEVDSNAHGSMMFNDVQCL